MEALCLATLIGAYSLGALSLSLSAQEDGSGAGALIIILAVLVLLVPIAGTVALYKTAPGDGDAVSGAVRPTLPCDAIQAVRDAEDDCWVSRVSALRCRAAPPSPGTDPSTRIAWPHRRALPYLYTLARPSRLCAVLKASPPGPREYGDGHLGDRVARLLFWGQAPVCAGRPYHRERETTKSRVLSSRSSQFLKFRKPEIPNTSAP